jgi:hypothetical protein
MATRRTKKHNSGTLKYPVSVKYTIHNFSDYERITEDDNTKAFVYLHLVNAVKRSISTNINSIELFKLTDFNSTLSLKREDWKDSLSNAIGFFADKELYEKAAECKHLISLL